MSIFCRECGKQIKNDAKFCPFCGTEVKTISSENNKSSVTDTVVVPSNEMVIIKCGNCGYEGPGELARSIVAQIFAWLCIFFAPLITIVYFAATHKYRCPKCKSTFLGVKNKKGVFVGQNGASRPIMIFIYVIVGIAIVGVLSSIILASLSTAQQKATDAESQSQMQNQ